MLPYSISSDALGLPDLLLPYSMIALALHNTPHGDCQRIECCVFIFRGLLLYTDVALGSPGLLLSSH